VASVTTPFAPAPAEEVYTRHAEPLTAAGSESGFTEENPPTAGTVEAGSLGDDLRQQEFRIIIQTLKNERGRRNKAAEQLGISPRTLRYKLAQMRDAGIDLDAELEMA
jgi:two-component system response regulator FlrC